MAALASTAAAIRAAHQMDQQMLRPVLVELHVWPKVAPCHAERASRPLAQAVAGEPMAKDLAAGISAVANCWTFI